MTEQGLHYISNCLEDLGLNYSFMEWTNPIIPDPYWIGEYTESEIINEDGKEDSTFVLTGTTKHKFIELETIKNRIKDYFPYYGLTTIFPDGSGIAISFSNSYPVPSVEEDVFRLQINLSIQEWRV